MKTKKNPKFDLETKRKLFFSYGLVISLTIVLLAFKNGNEVKEIYIPKYETDIIIDVFDIPNTSEPEKLIAPPPVLRLYDEIVIADNHSFVPDNDIVFDEINDPMPLSIIEETPEINEKPLIIAECMPEFPGGNKNLNKWLSRNLIYPENASKLGLKGRVYLNFVVGKDGLISDVKVTRGVDTLLNAEAERVISAMPKWKPGLQNGKPVAVSYNIFVTFQLN